MGMVVGQPSEVQALVMRLGELGGSFSRIANEVRDLIVAKEKAERERDSLARRLGVRFQENQQASEIIAYALHLRMYGERAPGGGETWAQFDRMAEDFLRGRVPSRVQARDEPCQMPGSCDVHGYSPVRVPENTGKHPGETAETGMEPVIDPRTGHLIPKKSLP